MSNHGLLFCFISAMALIVLVPQSVRAEAGAEARIQALHEEAVDAYSNMDMDTAVDVLERAIQMARIEGVSGRLPAQLQVTLGTVLVLGLNRLADGRDRLVAAARESGDVEPDPMLSTPLLDQLWQDVISEVRPADGGDGDGEGDGDGGEPMTFGQGRVIPIPINEQLPDHAVPIYVEIQQVRDVRRVLLAYRGAGQRRFLAIEMDEYHEGYAGRIPCHRVRPPQVEYFVNVLDSRGEIVANAGNSDEPLVVHIREELQGREPHLPNANPEPHCSEDTWSSQEEEQQLPSNSERLMYIEIGAGTGAGIPISSEQEQNTCSVSGATVFDLIEVNPSLAWTELVLGPALGFYIRPNITLGIRGRLQFGGAVYPDTPHGGGALAEFRFFPVADDPVRFFIQAGLGAGAVRHPIQLEGAVNCGDMYYREARYFMGMIGAGLLFDVHPLVALFAQLQFTITAPDVAIQGDILLGLNISIPRR